MKSRVYGYARVSTMRQSTERQIENIKSKYPEAIIIAEAYTGTKIDRPQWTKLYNQLREGDTIVFDEVSRMSRNAEEGFSLYKELYEKGVNLIFLKESTLNTDTFRNSAKRYSLTGDRKNDVLIKAMNELSMIIAEEQIQSAFESAQHEVDFLHQRVSEGVRRAQAQGKRIGTQSGDKLTTKKSIASKEVIRKHSKDFGGTLNDVELMKMTSLSRNTFYKYKRELKEEE